MVTHKELDELFQQARKAYAVGSVEIKHRLDRKYARVILPFGTSKSMTDAKRDLQEAKDRELQEEKKRLKEKIEAFHFGQFGGRVEAIKQVEEANTSFPKAEIISSGNEKSDGVSITITSRNRAK